MQFMSTSERLIYPRFGIKQLGGLRLSKLSIDERLKLENKGIISNCDDFLDIHDSSENAMDDLELNKFQIGKLLKSKHEEFEYQLRANLPDGLRDIPFTIINEFAKEIPITFEITQQAVDLMGAAPIKHVQTQRFHEFYRGLAVGHDLLLSQDEMKKTA